MPSMAQTLVLILRLPFATEERLSLIPNQSRRKASNAMKLATQCLVQEGKCRRLEKEISRWKTEKNKIRIAKKIYDLFCMRM